MRVLIVEDDDLVRRSLEALLRADGHETCWARTGEAAVRLLETEAETLGLVILDVQLVPGGMSGWDVARYKLAHPAAAAIPVIVVSGLSSVDIHRGATTNVLQGAIIVLGKPVDPHTLRSAVESVAEGRKHPAPDGGSGPAL